MEDAEGGAEGMRCGKCGETFHNGGNRRRHEWNCEVGMGVEEECKMCGRGGWKGTAGRKRHEAACKEREERNRRGGGHGGMGSQEN